MTDASAHVSSQQQHLLSSPLHGSVDSLPILATTMHTLYCSFHNKPHFLVEAPIKHLGLAAAHCLRPSRQRAYQMTDPHNKKSSSSGPGQRHSELISMYDSHTWPETRRSETFHSQASKLWEFVTEELVRATHPLTRLGPHTFTLCACSSF